MTDTEKDMSYETTSNEVILSYHLKCEMEYKYGVIFEEILDSISMWKRYSDIPSDKYVILSDKNSVSLFQSYLEGETQIALKHSLAKVLGNRDYIPYTISIIHGKSYRPKRKIIQSSDGNDRHAIWFLKPSNRFVGEGKDIKLLSTLEEFDINDKHLEKYTHWVLQEEVYPPLLFNGSKFVVRFFSFHVYAPKVLFVYAGSKCRFNIYAKEYSDDSNIEELSQISHNNLNLTSGNMTRIGTSSGLFTLDGDYVADSSILMGEILWPQILTIITDITNTMTNTTSTYDTMGCYGYSIHGYDFMVRDDNKVFLIEVNEHPYLNFEPNSLKQAISMPLFHDVVNSFANIVQGREPTPLHMTLIGKYKMKIKKRSTPLEGKTLLI